MSTKMDRYEARRLALIALIAPMGRGGRKNLASVIGREPSYVSRLLYPLGKPGRKRIGDELVAAITAAYPHWLLPEKPKSTNAVATPSRFGEHVFHHLDAPSGLQLIPAVSQVVMSSNEVISRLGFIPEPGRVQLATQVGPSMLPEFDKGTIMFIDTEVRSFVGDDYYLVYMGEETQVKLLQRRGAHIWVVSLNPAFPSWPWTDTSPIVILGACLGRWDLRFFEAAAVPQAA